jgi:hypothetical protein
MVRLDDPRESIEKNRLLVKRMVNLPSFLFIYGPFRFYHEQKVQNIS